MPTPCKCSKTNARCRLQAHGCWGVWQRRHTNMFMWDENEAKIHRSNFIFTALPLVETSLSFYVYCIVTPNPNCPDDTTQNRISLANFRIQRYGSFQHKARDQIPLNLRKRGEGGRGGGGEEERFKSLTNDIQKLWTCWCAGSGLILNWIMRRHPVHTALMSGEAGRWRGEGEEGGRGRMVGGYYVQVGGGGWVFPSDAAAEPFKSDSQEEMERDNKGVQTEGWKKSPEMSFQRGREGDQDRKTGYTKINAAVQTNPQAKLLVSHPICLRLNSHL